MSLAELEVSRHVVPESLIMSRPMSGRDVGPLLLVAMLLGAGTIAARSIGAQEAGRAFASSIAPGVLRPNGDDWTPALTFDVEGRMRRHVVRPRYPYSPYARGEARGALTIDADENPEQLRAAGAAGIAVDLVELQAVPFNPADVDAPGSAARFDYGTISLGAQLDLRSDQRAREVLGALQAELLYTHDHQRAFWPLVPAVAIAYGLRRPLRSELYDELAIERESLAQLDASAFWHLSLDRPVLPTLIRPFWIHGEVRYFGASGSDAAIEQAGLDEGSYVAATLAYRARRPVSAIDELFVRWSDGELQTRPGDRRAWMVGIVIRSP